MMWCDINVAHTLSYFEMKMMKFPPFDLGKWPKVAALKKKVEAHPKIAAWIETRPKSAF